MSCVFSTPYLQIRSDGLLLYEQPDEIHARRHDKMLAAKAYGGGMTHHGRMRVMRSVDMLLQRNPKRRIFNPVRNIHHDFQVGFCTLTIPDPTPIAARDAHKHLLAPFLRTARRVWGVNDYVWKAELQERGQLHYHITWAEFVHLDLIRAEWNKHLRLAGLSQMYAKKHGHYNPNSIDIHAVWKIRNLKAYLAKYIAKTTQNQTALDGKVWDCSTELKRPFFSTELTTTHEQYIADAVAHNQAQIIRLQNCTIVKCDNPQSVLSPHEKALYKTHLT